MEDTSKTGLDFSNLEIVPDPQFKTPYELLTYYAPAYNWEYTRTLTWDHVRNDPTIQNILTGVLAVNTRPLILRKKS